MTAMERATFRIKRSVEILREERKDDNTFEADIDRAVADGLEWALEIITEEEGRA